MLLADHGFTSMPPMQHTDPVASEPARRPTLARMFRLSRAAHAERTPGGLLQTGLLFLRLLQRRRELNGWCDADGSPLREMLTRRPTLASVVRRPYVSTGWSAARRVTAVGEHYRLLSGAASPLRVLPHEQIELATVASAAGAVTVVLDSPAWFVHEGELALNLFHGGERIYTVAFSLGFDHGETVAYVGALQGYGNERALQLYRSLTHDMHGLRPRDLLIAAFRTVCREVGVKRWLAVGNQHRVSCSPYFQRETGLNANYDEAWSEQGSSLRADGFHVLSSQPRRRAHGDIPSRKRSAYRQRYEMLDRLDAELERTLQARRHSLLADCHDAAPKAASRDPLSKAP